MYAQHAQHARPTAVQAKLYHREVFAPQSLFKSPGVVSLTYSHHARNAAVDDRYRDLTPYLSRYIDLDECEIVEVETVNGRITKRVVRCPIDSELTMVLVIGADGYVRTVWGNLNSDQHASLHRGRYARSL